MAESTELVYGCLTSADDHTCMTPAVLDQLRGKRPETWTCPRPGCGRVHHRLAPSAGGTVAYRESPPLYDDDPGLPFNAVFDNQPQPRQWRIPYPPEPTDVAAVAPVDAPERIFRRHVDPMVGPTWRDQFGAETTWEILLADYIQGVREVPGA